MPTVELPPEERRNCRVNVRLTAGELKAFTALAKTLGKNKTELILEMLHDGMMTAHRLGKVDAGEWRNLFTV